MEGIIRLCREVFFSCRLICLVSFSLVEDDVLRKEVVFSNFSKKI